MKPKIELNSLEARLFTPSGEKDVVIEFDQRIRKILPIKNKKNRPLPYIVPGFIDLHCHGGGGYDFHQGQEHFKKIILSHLKNGTTSLLPTTVSAPPENLIEFFKNLRDFSIKEPYLSQVILGVHLEGPYLDSQKLGAQPNFSRKLSLREITELHKIFPIKVITLAPEQIPGISTLERLKKLSIKVQLGHSNCSFEKAEKLCNLGLVDSFTHLYNAMSGFHHRAPGIAGAALVHANYSEIIPDLLHVHPGAIKLALKSIKNLYFVTDATAASGAKNGMYKLGEQEVFRCHNGVRLADGTLAGSSLLMKEAFQNGHKLGLTFQETSKRCSLIQARYLGIPHLGKIKTGAQADFVLLNKRKNFKVERVYKAGNSTF